MAKQEKPQPDPDGITRLTPGYTKDAETFNGIRIRAGEPGFVKNTRGDFVQRPPIESVRTILTPHQE